MKWCICGSRMIVDEHGVECCVNPNCIINAKGYA